jgi:aminoglycoside 3-N-acetyltransferase
VGVDSVRSMISYRDLVTAFRALGLDGESRVIAHVSLTPLGGVAGGEETVLGALLANCASLIMPAFTLRTLVIPAEGPAENGMAYGADNHWVEPYDPRMPADAGMGEAVEVLRRHPQARRSSHPALSFVGVRADEFLQEQTLAQPLAPIGRLAEMDADVVLLGVDHRVNVSLHYAESLAERKQFVRWSLTEAGVVDCPNWPGCAEGFTAIDERLEGVIRQAPLGDGVVQSIPLRDLIHVAVAWMHEDPRALLCENRECERCGDVRAWIRRGG